MSRNSLDVGDHAVVALVADLLFTARVRGAAPGAKVVQRAGALADVVGPHTRTVLVDLQAADALAAIRALKDRSDTTPTVIAFAPHVETEALKAAREAGADRVMARGAFVKALPDLVAEGGF